MDTKILGEGPKRKEPIVARQTRYPSKFKVEAVALVKSSGCSIADVARSLGVSDLCHAIGLPRLTYYARLSHQPSQREYADNFPVAIHGADSN